MERTLKGGDASGTVETKTPEAASGKDGALEERKKERRTEREGVRKAAVLLSILDSESAAALLERFEPSVAREIVDEARRVGPIAREDVDAVVAEFLTFGELGARNDKRKPDAERGASRSDVSARTAATKPVKPVKPTETKRTSEPKNVSSLAVASSETSGERPRANEFCPLETLDVESLTGALRDESPSTVAAALARVDSEARDAVLRAFPNETREAIERWTTNLAPFKPDGTPFFAFRALEDAVFNAALELDV